MFFVTLLSIPEKDIRIAWQVFDIDGNGEVDIHEFKQIMAMLRANTPIATSRRSQTKDVRLCNAHRSAER
jgi:Ca2+-binding EF-hand superfamily protein